nr:reverse transcriptase domain-containing protein [Tanacetum cinerariifolium]
MNNNHNQEPPPQNNNGPPPMVRPNGQAPRLMKELCQPSMNGQGGPIASIPIQATDFGLRHHMIQQRFEMKHLEISLLVPRVLTINAAAGGTFMQKTPKECYELIKNMTAHHNHWDTLAIRDETSRNISSSTESPKVPEVTKDTVQPSTKKVQPPVIQSQVPIDEPVVAPKPKSTIPYQSRANKQKLREKDDNLALKFVEIFRKLHFELSFADALLHMPKFDLMFKSLLNNKEKLFDLATTPVNENCSAVILKKLPKKLGDPDKFLIPCDLPELVECLALADLGASINLMPLSIWKKLSLPELTPTQMILELADRSTTRPAGIAEDVFVEVGKIRRALIDVYGEELTLRVDDEAITFKVGQTSKYSYNDAELINRIDVIDVVCEGYVQEVLGFSDKSKSSNPTLISDPIIALSSPLSLLLREATSFWKRSRPVLQANRFHRELIMPTLTEGRHSSSRRVVK